MQNIEDGLNIEIYKMPCGANQSCLDCTHYYHLSCSHLERMTDEEHKAHEKKLYAGNK